MLWDPVWWFGGGGGVVVFVTDYNTTPTKLFCFVMLVGLWQQAGTELCQAQDKLWLAKPALSSKKLRSSSLH